MNKLFKQFVAFAIAAVMVFGLLPTSVLAVESHEHEVTSDVEPFTSTEDLIQQVKEKLIKAGKTTEEEPVDEALAEAVEDESDYSYQQAVTMLGLGFFDNREGTEGKIDTSYLGLSPETMESLVNAALATYTMNSDVQVEYVTENGVVTAVDFTMDESLASVLDELAEPAAPEQETEAEAATAVASYAVDAKAAHPFTDIKGHWAEDEIAYLYARKIVAGTTDTTYGPEVKMDRAMVVTMLWRLEGKPQPTKASPFTDLKKGEYYVDAVNWAAENNIVSGTTTTTFSPNGKLTREQLVSIMYRYAKYQGLDVSKKASLSTFTDASTISEYAKEAVQWAVGCGIISGNKQSNGTYTFAPKRVATRAEYARIMYVYVTMGHQMTHYPAKANTCTTDGNIEYWFCSHCGKYFADADGSAEIPDANKDGKITAEDTVLKAEHVLVKVEAKVATCTTDGVAAHYACACGAVVMDAQGNPVSDKSTLVTPASGHYPPEDATNVAWSWERVVDYDYNKDANGYPTFNMGLTDAEGNPVPDFRMDENGNMVASLYFNPETGEITPGYPEIISWVCSDVSFTCVGCGKDITSATETTSYVMTEEWINYYLEGEPDDDTDGYVGEVAAELITDYVTQKSMDYYMSTGSAPSEEQQYAWIMEAQQDPEIMAQIEQKVTMKAYELYQDMNSTIFAATTTDENVAEMTNEVNQTKDQLQRDWATMTSFNDYYPQYMGLAAPYWTSKNTEASPLGAILYLVGQQEQPFIPNYDMDYMVSMLTQAFMSYVMQYGYMLDAMVADVKALVDQPELDTIDKLLLIHDWVAENGTFDMQSLVDITSGVSSGNDPIAMTAFGTLLNDQIQKAEGATWDGGVCLGYTAAYSLMVQQALGLTAEDEAMIDFVQIKYLTNVEDSSVAAGDSGFGDGDAMFNSSHFLNAVKLGDTWYYVDSCYDDIDTEVVSQYRVETEGNVSHSSFLISPATWEEMYDGNFQFMDSLYDGKVWNRIPDGAGGYQMQDNEGTVYATEQEAKDAQEARQADNDADGNDVNGDDLQLFYVYEATETTDEVRYDDTIYEEAWFVSAKSVIKYDPATQYFYYTSGAITSYSSMKDMFGDSEEGSDDSGMSMDQEDMLEYKYQPSAQDKIVRRPVDAPNEGDNSSSTSMTQSSDEYAEVLFHYGYGSIGAEAQADYEEDSQSNSMMGGDSSAAGNEGPYYDLVMEDAAYLDQYPDLVHSTVLMDGKLYFNIGNSIYTFNYGVEDIAMNAIDSITTLELVKLKEYNEISYSSNGKAFTGMSFEADPNGKDTLVYHPIAALSVRDVITWTDSDDDGNADARNSEQNLFVSIGTNLSNSYKPDDAEAYTIEARNYNPDYYRFMEEEEETTEKTNDNVEFMWCANVVEKMPVADLLADLESGATAAVSVDAYCGRDAFTETRTTKYGLSTDGVKTYTEDSALEHNYAADEVEGTNICSVCLVDHEHDYGYAVASDVDFVWTVVTSNVTNEDGTTSQVETLTAEAYIYCGNDDYCNVDEKVTCTVVDNEDGTFTATATYGTLTATETKTVDQVKHNVHNYAAPVFEWTSDTQEVTAEDGTVTTVTTWSATATFTCKATEAQCIGSDAEGERVVVDECDVSTESGEPVATAIGPDGATYTDTMHIYSADDAQIVLDEGKDNYTATYNCTVCDNVVTITGSVAKDTESKKATCTEAGEVVYTATASSAAVLSGTEDKTRGELPTVTYTVTEAVAAKGHSFSRADAWNADLTQCDVTYTCSACGTVETAKAEVTTAVTAEATCTTDGTLTATAVVKYADGTERETFTKTQTIPATGHKYGEPVVSWYYHPADGETAESMTATVRRDCVNKDCTDSQPKDVTKPENVNGVWTATYIDDGETITITHTHVTEGTCSCGYVASTPDTTEPTQPTDPSEPEEGGSEESGSGDGE